MLSVRFVTCCLNKMWNTERMFLCIDRTESTRSREGLLVHFTTVTTDHRDWSCHMSHFIPKLI